MTNISLHILKENLNGAKERLLYFENQKQFHLKQMRECNQEQTTIQQVIDDLHKTIEYLKEDEDEVNA